MTLPEPTLDRAALESVVEMAGDGAVELLDELLRVYGKTVESSVSALREALQMADARTFFQRAHGLKGAAANLGLARTSQLAGELEHAGRTNALEGCAPILEELAAEVPRADRAVRGFIATMRRSRS